MAIINRMQNELHGIGLLLVPVFDENDLVVVDFELHRIPSDEK